MMRALGRMQTAPPLPGSARSYATLVRWRDLDAMNHVNNAVFFTYLEEARLRWTRDLYEASPPETEWPPGWIVASARINYLRPLYLGDTVDVVIAVRTFGRTSFVFDYEIRSRAQAAVAARAETVQVGYDYGAGRAVPLSESARAAIARFEGREIPGRTP